MLRTTKAAARSHAMVDVLKKLKGEAKARQNKGGAAALAASGPKYEPGGKFFVSSNWKSLLQKRPEINPKAASRQPDAAKANIVALDCEFVGVGPDGERSALARVSLVDGEGSILLDRFVKPQEFVTDFRTSITGIRKEMLNGVGVLTEEAARGKVAEMIQGKIVVGHALQNDFRVLQLFHPHALIRDTSMYKPLRPPFRAKKTPSLKLLCKHWLHEDIHTGNHNSVEDARMALRLYQSQSKQWERQMQGAMQSAAERAPHDNEDDEGEAVERVLNTRQENARSETAISGSIGKSIVRKKRKRQGASDGGPTVADADDSAAGSGPMGPAKKVNPGKKKRRQLARAA